ncbi:MAG: esterase/lipase family protein [Phycisphaeraceae bacterium JB051]
MQQFKTITKWLTICVMLVSTLGVQGQPTTSPIDNSLVSEVRLPLESGDVKLGDLLGQLLDWLDVQSQMVRRRCADMKIPVTGPIGELKLETLNELTDGVVSFETTDALLVMRVDRLALRRKDKQIRHDFREKMESWFPDLASQAYAQNGLWSLRPEGVLAPLPNAFQMDRVVILVHGLDEPGDIWDELIPALQQAGHTVLVFVYPNDQPIAQSADLFAEHLAKLPATGIQSMSLVAHSMGGLVSREVLTNEKYTGYPQAKRLVTVGTPHHGSGLAHFQFVGEIRDQIVRAFSGDGLLFGAVFDGAGEAKIDLLPNSEFLTTLNARPNPKDLTITCIVGNASPVNMDEVRDFEAKCADLLNDGQNDQKFSQTIEQLTNGIGDGCVSMTSAHLEGVTDEVVVQANHRTLLRTIPVISTTRQPPAIPIILDRLKDQLPENPQD